jgi:hypothetical protein
LFGWLFGCLFVCWFDDDELRLVNDTFVTDDDDDDDEPVRPGHVAVSLCKHDVRKELTLPRAEVRFMCCCCCLFVCLFVWLVVWLVVGCWFDDDELRAVNDTFVTDDDDDDDEPVRPGHVAVSLCKHDVRKELTLPRAEVRFYVLLLLFVCLFVLFVFDLFVFYRCCSLRVCAAKRTM